MAHHQPQAAATYIPDLKPWEGYIYYLPNAGGRAQGYVGQSYGAEGDRIAQHRATKKNVNGAKVVYHGPNLNEYESYSIGRYNTYKPGRQHANQNKGPSPEHYERGLARYRKKQQEKAAAAVQQQAAAAAAAFAQRQAAAAAAAAAQQRLAPAGVHLPKGVQYVVPPQQPGVQYVMIDGVMHALLPVHAAAKWGRKRKR